MEGLVRRIVVDIVTAYSEGAGTKGEVYLGLGGREFRLQLQGEKNVDRGAELNYQLGDDSNLEHPERNDPRLGMPITVAAVLAQPAYLRMVAKSASDDWHLESVQVRVLHDVDRRTIRFSALDGPGENIWLGPQSGTTLFLTRSALDRSGLAD